MQPATRPGGPGAVFRVLAAPLCPTIIGAATRRPVLSLTFDDGPDPGTTPRLLDLLGEHGARATFFVIGARAARHPRLVARMLAEGHEVGNHTWDHPSLPGLPSGAVAGQLRRAAAALAPHAPALARPPYGDQTLRTNRVTRRLGYQVVAWSIDAEDWRGDDAEMIVQRVTARAAPGAIVLMHDALHGVEGDTLAHRKPTLDAVAAILARMQACGFVTVTELLASGRPVRRAWLQNPKRRA